MQDLYLTLLETFKNERVGRRISISRFMCTYFKKPITTSHLQWIDEIQTVDLFIAEVQNKGHLFVEYENDFFDYNVVTKEHTWFDNTEVYAYKTVEAVQYFEQMDLNASIIEANYISAETNKVITRNSVIQTKAISQQTYLLVLTASFTAISLGISIYNLRNDSFKERQQNEISEQKKQIQLLQNKLDQKIIDAFQIHNKPSSKDR